jgi:dTDP-4-dehydrorhamnose 3,5-epimerase-like enzyme
MLLEGKKYQDERGIITFNNDFDASQIKRIYTIENNSTEFVRGWQGHKIEQRWFACLKGSFEISVIEVDDFMQPSKDLTIQKYLLKEDTLTYLHIPAGFITAIQSQSVGSKLLVLADYKLGEINDEYRFDLNYFKFKKHLKLSKNID